MHSRYNLCPELDASSYCFVLEQYETGRVERIEHVHVPRHRISKPEALEVLKTLVSRFWGKTGMSTEMILNSRVNNRNGFPRPSGELKITVEYPENGVLRYYCGTDTVAWCDQVVEADNFRVTS